MPEKKHVFKYGLFLIFIITALFLVVLVMASDETGAENEIDCRYKGGFGGWYGKVAYDGEYLYVGHIQGLSIFDVSDPSNPKRIGSILTNGSAGGVAVSGDYAYVGDSVNRLLVVDVSDPENPTLEGSCDTNGSACDVVVSGGYAYVADYKNGLVIVDISDPSDPQLEGQNDTAGWAFGVTVNGEYAYVADFDNGLVVVDISDPEDPKEEGHYDTAGGVQGVAVSGGYAYVADGSNGLVVVDISDPNDPTLKGSCNTPGSAIDVAVNGGFAYVADRDRGLVIVDIGNPKNPTREGSYNTAGFVRGVTVNESYAYVTNIYNGGLDIVDINDPTNPAPEGSYYPLGRSKGVAVSGDYAYVTNFPKDLVIVNISNKQNPKREGQYSTDGFASDVAVSGDYAYVTFGNNGLIILDITDKTNPKKVGEDTSGGAGCVVIRGSYAYVTSGSLRIIDISDPENPEEEGQYDTAGYARAVAVSGDYAYVADDDNGLVILDISNPSNPQFKGHYDTAGQAEDVAVSGDYACVSDGDNGLVIVDISDKENPKEEGHYDTAGYAYEVAVSGSYAFVADDDHGLIIVELAPVAWIDSISPNPALDTDTIHFEGHGTDDGEVVRYVWTSSLDGEIHNSTEANFSNSTLSLGEHTIYFRVQDNYGIWSDEINTHLIVHQKPTADIISISPNPANDTDVISFNALGIDDGSIERYNWRSDVIGEFYNGTNDNFLEKLPAGVHIIYLKVQDNFGVWSDEVSTPLTVRVKPKIVSLSTSEGPLFKGESINFTCNATDDGTIERYVWTSSREDGEFYNGTEAEFDYYDLSVGSHFLSVKVADDEELWSDIWIIGIVIYAIPDATIESINPYVAWEGENITFIGSATDEDGDIIKFSWRSSINGGLYNGSNGSVTLANLTIGTHTIYLKVQDNDGFWSEEVLETVIVRDPADPVNIPPDIVVTSPDNNSEVSGTVTVSGNASDVDGNETIQSVEISIDGGDWQIITGTDSWNFQWDTTFVENGEHNLKFRAFDGTDFSEIVEISLNVQNPENIPPTIILTYPTNGSEIYGRVIVKGTSTDDDGTVQKVEIKIGNGIWEPATGTSQWTFEWNTKAVKNGNYTIRVRCYDGKNYSEVVSITVTVENKDAGEDGGDSD
ncbi:MAG: hypothetical protein KAU14_07885, partial [Thermoplasmata archaeon]|nr:hypothetical protein [Thermoplasmata archaeon]